MAKKKPKSAFTEDIELLQEIYNKTKSQVEAEIEKSKNGQEAANLDYEFHILDKISSSIARLSRVEEIMLSIPTSWTESK